MVSLITAQRDGGMMLERLKRSLEESPVVNIGDYEYFVNPITDGIPRMDPNVLQEVVDRILEVGDFDCDLIVAPEAMGIPLAVPLSLRTGIPYNVVRKRRYGLPGEVSLQQTTGYSRTDMFINGISEGDRVVIVDDVISTGGTIAAIGKALQGMGVRIVDIIVVVEKGDRRPSLERELGVAIKTLVKVEVRQGRTMVVT
jgi:adenine phosphoribosyltransferase